jgi:uncharacterized protein DUF1592/uncharacterized protein DUF1588/uncharacterized protein DUF1595/uncharacterized protein DUF1585/uncharacterized protein DUF1587
MSRAKRAGNGSQYRLFTSLGLALVALNGCAIDAPRGSDGGMAGSTSSAGSGGAPVTPQADTAGPRPLSRLTHREYNNTVRDLLGDTSHPADDFAEDRDRAFLFRRAGLVATQDAELLRTSAETLAQTAMKSPTKVLPCAASAGEDACAAQFIQTFGQRAYRRPLSAAETTSLTALYSSARGTLQLGFNDAIGVLLEAMLQSPAFLYHWESPYAEPQRQGDLVALGPYDVASRLSYFIWGSMPDQALFDAAANGKLASDADIAAQASRMLADGKAKDAITAFFREWLEIDQLAALPKDSGAYPEYTDALKTAMAGETEAFARSVVFDGDGKFETLLTANYSFNNKTLGSVYGTSASGTALVKTPLDPNQRLGLLTQPSFLSMTGSPDGSNPVKRGKAVYMKLLCGELPPPPPNVPAAKPATAGGTTRERFSEHDQNECATGCHSLMDPLGFAFEHYDGIGRYRAQDNGQAVDSSSKLTLDGSEHTFSDALELTKVLSTSDSVRSCFAKQWFRFAMGRVETADDAPALASVQVAFQAHEFDVRDLPPAIAVSRSFRFRSLAAGEK